MARSKWQYFVIGVGLILFILQPAGVVRARTAGNACVSARTGTWGTAGTWVNCGGISPQSGDTAEILSGHIVTISGSDANVLSITIQSGGAIAYDVTTRILNVYGDLTSNTSTPISGATFGTIRFTCTACSSFVTHQVSGASNLRLVKVSAATKNQVNTNTSLSLASLTIPVSTIFYLGGDLSVDATVTLNGILTLNSFTLSRATPGGLFTMNSGSLLELTNSNFPSKFTTYTLNTGSTVSYNGSGVQTIDNTPTYYNLTTSNNGVKTLKGNTSIGGDLNIDVGTTLDVSASNFTINLNGSFTNNGAFTAQAGTVNFNGFSVIPQKIFGSSQTVFYTLKNRSTYIDNETNILEDSSAPGAFASFINNNGVIRRQQAVDLIIDATPTLEFSIAGYYNGVNMSIKLNENTDLTNITVDRIDQDHPNKTSRVGNGIYWIITPNTDETTYNADVILPHNLTPASAYACRYTETGTDWACDRQVGDTGQTVTYAGTTEFSDWATGDGSPTAVEVEYLTSARAIGNGGSGVSLAWKTVSEANTVGFNVYRRALAGGALSKVNSSMIPAQTPGAMGGNTYAYDDTSANTGVAYEYRLEALDTSMMVAYTMNVTYLPAVMYLPMALR